MAIESFSMINSISQSVATVIASAGLKSPFSNRENQINEMNPGEQILFFIVFIFLIYFTMWLGAFIFNSSIVNIFPSVKKVSTLDFLGLYIVIHLLFC